MGFTQPAGHPAAGELLPHHFALTRRQFGDVGRYVSVALSLRSPSLAVSQHPALWSSDFPRAQQPAIALLPQIQDIEYHIWGKPSRDFKMSKCQEYSSLY